MDGSVCWGGGLPRGLLRGYAVSFSLLVLAGSSGLTEDRMERNGLLIPFARLGNHGFAPTELDRCC